LFLPLLSADGIVRRVPVADRGRPTVLPAPVRLPRRERHPGSGLSGQWRGLSRRRRGSSRIRQELAVCGVEYRKQLVILQSVE